MSLCHELLPSEIHWRFRSFPSQADLFLATIDALFGDVNDERQLHLFNSLQTRMIAKEAENAGAGSTSVWRVVRLCRGSTEEAYWFVPKNPDSVHLFLNSMWWEAPDWTWAMKLRPCAKAYLQKHTKSKNIAKPGREESSSSNATAP